MGRAFTPLWQRTKLIKIVQDLPELDLPNSLANDPGDSDEQAIWQLLLAPHWPGQRSNWQWAVGLGEGFFTIRKAICMVSAQWAVYQGEWAYNIRLMVFGVELEAVRSSPWPLLHVSCIQRPGEALIEVLGCKACRMGLRADVANVYSLAAIESASLPGSQQIKNQRWFGRVALAAVSWYSCHRILFPYQQATLSVLIEAETNQ